MNIIDNLTLVNFNSMNNRNIEYIVIHYVGGKSSAYDNSRYFKSVNRGASAHYFVDDNVIYRVVLDKDRAWHCGGGLQGSGGHKFFQKCTNSNSIGIEMCCDLDANGNLYINDKVIANTAELVQTLMKKYNIKSENVIRHYDVTGKLCPAPYVNESKWASLKNILIGNTAKPAPAPISSVATVEEAKKYVGTRVVELQTKLIRLGYNCGNGKADGSFGNGTYQSLLQFQRNNGLKADAYAGTATFGKLDELIAKKNAEEQAKREAEERARREAEAKANILDTVSEVQSYLNRVNNAGLAVDGSYGNNTRKALIKYWQKTVGGLSIDGDFGANSQAKASRNNISQGSKGEIVKIMQMALICKGYSFGAYGADGSYGSATAEVVKKFQRNVGLGADGVVGKNTWIKIFS